MPLGQTTYQTPRSSTWKPPIAMSQSFIAPRSPRGLIAVSGEDRVAFLQGLVSNDVTRVSETRAIHAALLTPQGKYLHDFFVMALGDVLLLDTEGERAADLKRRLSIYKLRSKIVLDDWSDRYAVWIAWGETALAAAGLELAGDARPLEGGIALVDPRLADLGLRFVLPQGAGDAPLRALGFAPGNSKEFEYARLSLGVPDGSRDLVIDKTILLEAGFDELNGVDWKKGCYMGQELTARTKYRGLVKKRLMPVMVDGPLPEPGTPVMAGEQEAGEIRSGQGDRALALLRLEAANDPAAILTAGGARLTPAKPGWAAF
jgi:folate-binding protein YgfZ